MRWRHAQRSTRLLAACVAALFACQRASATFGEFGSADAAAYALVEAMRSDDVPMLREILGDAAHDAVPLGGAAADRARRRALADASGQRVLLDYQSLDRVVLRIGDAQLPFPVPIVAHDGVWRFASDERLDTSRWRPS